MWINLFIFCLFGSSPRVRGTRGLPSGVPGRTAVHPRVCGELLPAPVYTSAICGSSPRVRGTRHGRSSTTPARRFIPACAGNSSSLSPSKTACAVHPRVCGELPLVGGERPQPARFIPACAGNSPGRAHPTPGRTVHPRVCGELEDLLRERVEDAGSSPRVRGTPRALRPFHAALRFIPACAGNSWLGCMPGRFRPVHPRVCGELSRTSVLVSP